MQKTLHTGELRPKRFLLSSFLLRRRNLIIEIIAALYILLFVYTGVNKFIAFKDLREVLKEYPLIGTFSEIIVWSVPITELLVAVLLFIPKTKRLGLILSTALMSVFTVYLSYIMIFATNMPCTCGGMLQEMTWSQHLIFNLFFIILAAIGMRLQKRGRN